MSDRSRWRSTLLLAAAAAAGAVAAIAVDRVVFDDGDPSAGAGDVTLTPDDLGAGWALDATLTLGGDGDAGMLNGCALALGVPADVQGAFTSLSDSSGDIITSEVRVTSSASEAAELFEGATALETTECIRAGLEADAIGRYAPATPVAAFVEPLETTPWAEQSRAYRIRVDVTGQPLEWLDVHVLRGDRAIAVVQVLDQAERIASEVPVNAVRAVLDGLTATFDRR